MNVGSRNSIALLVLGVSFLCCSAGAFMLHEPTLLRQEGFSRLSVVKRVAFSASARAQYGKKSTTDNTGSAPSIKNMMQLEFVSKRHQGTTSSAVAQKYRSIPGNTRRPERQTDFQPTEAEFDAQKLIYGAAALLVVASVGIGMSLGVTPGDAFEAVQRFFANPQASLQATVNSVQDMGPAAPIYFGIIYLVAEILAVPATPLTLSAGYLFGLTEGVSVVLLAATAAACIAFFVGKTFLRSYVERIIQDNPKFAKIDKAVGKEGFKLLLLIRLSPIFPFALSNYVYGASSIDFVPYFFGTLLGFTPGTIAYVYTGMVGKALTLGQGDQPWYVYAGGLGVLVIILKLISDVATQFVTALDEESND